MAQTCSSTVNVYVCMCWTRKVQLFIFVNRLGFWANESAPTLTLRFHFTIVHRTTRSPVPGAGSARKRLFRSKTVRARKRLSVRINKVENWMSAITKSPSIQWPVVLLPSINIPIEWVMIRWRKYIVRSFKWNGWALAVATVWKLENSLQFLSVMIGWCFNKSYSFL